MNEGPILFPVNLNWTGGKNGELHVQNKAVIKTGTSSGKMQFHSPEDLFVASATICYMNGFINFTEKMHIEFKAFSCEAAGVLEQVGRSFEITRIDMKARVEIESEDIRGKIQRALELAAKYCFVGNSMKCPISHETEIIIT